MHNSRLITYGLDAFEELEDATAARVLVECDAELIDHLVEDGRALRNCADVAYQHGIVLITQHLLAEPGRLERGEHPDDGLDQSKDRVVSWHLPLCHRAEVTADDVDLLRKHRYGRVLTTNVLCERRGQV